MDEINFKKQISSSVDGAISKVTESLKNEGYGLLTRIDFHLKIKEKLGKDIPPVIILGACKPSLAYEAFLKYTDVTSLIPCNVVIRDIGKGKVSVEIAKPSTLLKVFGDAELVCFAEVADKELQRVLEAL